MPYMDTIVYEREMEADKTWGGKIKADHELSESFRLKYGFDFSNSRTGGEEVSYDESFFSVTNQVAEASDDYTELQVLSGFVQEEWDILSPLELMIGLRFDYWEKTNHGDDWVDEADQETKQRWSPKSRLTWNAAPGTCLWTAASRAVRFPEMPDYARWRVGLVLSERNNLVPEDAAEFEVGVQQNIADRGSMALTLYRYDVDDYIRQDNSEPPPRIRGLYSIDKVTLQGINVEGEVGLSKTLHPVRQLLLSGVGEGRRHPGPGQRAQRQAHGNSGAPGGGGIAVPQSTERPGRSFHALRGRAEGVPDGPLVLPELGGYL